MSENKFRLFETDYTINGEHATRLKFHATLTNLIILKRRKFLNDILTST